MAWEWVAPVVTGMVGGTGVFFTWLTAAQSRAQVERVTVRADIRAEREKVTQERRDAYMAALQVTRLELARKKYRRTGETEKLADVEEKWPKGERVRMWIDARIRIEAFGSIAARDYLERCSASSGAGDEKQMKEVYDEMLKLIRAELGISSFGTAGLAAKPLDP